MPFLPPNQQRQSTEGKSLPPTMCEPNNREIVKFTEGNFDRIQPKWFHTHTIVLWLWIFSCATWVSRYWKKHSPTHQLFLICFIHLIQSMASSLFHLHVRAWQSFSTICLRVFFGLPLGLAPSTSYSIHFFSQLLFSFHNTYPCPYHRSLFCYSTKIMSSNPSLSTLYLEFYLVASRHTSI